MSVCATPGCLLPRYHRGICTGPLQADARARAEAALSRPCSTPGCGMTLRHEVCVTRGPNGRRVSLNRTVADLLTEGAERDLRQGAKRGPYGPGEFTPYTARPGRRVGLWALVRAACTTPLGAMFGLLLLALLWLSGCA